MHICKIAVIGSTCCLDFFLWVRRLELLGGVLCEVFSAGSRGGFLGIFVLTELLYTTKLSIISLAISTALKILPRLDLELRGNFMKNGRRCRSNEKMARSVFLLLRAVPLAKVRRQVPNNRKRNCTACRAGFRRERATKEPYHTVHVRVSPSQALQRRQTFRSASAEKEKKR